MKVGDLVRIVTINRLGLIVKQKPTLAIGLKVFEVLVEDGAIRTKTTAAMEKWENEEDDYTPF